MVTIGILPERRRPSAPCRSLVSRERSLGLVAGPAAAAPVVTGGLVNVTIIDAVDVNNNDVNVQVPVSAAANICGVDVEILVADLADDGEANCTARSASKARR